jgi:hypothetical protein
MLRIPIDRCPLAQLVVDFMDVPVEGHGGWSAKAASWRRACGITFASSRLCGALARRRAAPLASPRSRASSGPALAIDVVAVRELSSP